MEYILKNKDIAIKLNDFGAELVSMKTKRDGTEYIWTAESKYWGRHAPILFPIVGKLKNNRLKIKDKSYEMGQHGFARDSMFDVKEQTENSLLFGLKWNDDTIKKYPYKFDLTVGYMLEGKKLNIIYGVKNIDDKDIYFSIGAHPAFNCPMISDDEDISNTYFDDYYVEFEKKEEADAKYLNSDGLIMREAGFDLSGDVLKLSQKLFQKGVLIFDKLKSNKVSLRNIKNSRGISMDFEGFPYLGIWTKLDAPFICLEPWYGIADYEDFDGDFENKEGVMKLSVGEKFSAKYSITVF